MDLQIVDGWKVGPKEARSRTHAARLVIPPDDFAAHSPFLLMAEDWFAPPAGFPTHPHRGMETVTFVLEGELEHKDHTGGHGVLRTGAVQFMTAGNGVLHSEMPGPEGVHSLQLWLNLPAALKRTPAQYKDRPRATAPLHEAAGVTARLYAGQLGNHTVPHGSTWPLTVIDLTLEAGARYSLPLPAGQRAFVYLLSGDVKLGTNAVAMPPESVALTEVGPARTGTDMLPMTAMTAARAIVCASPPIDEPVVARGPFVMNSEDEIAEAFADYRAGRLTESRAG